MAARASSFRGALAAALCLCSCRAATNATVVKTESGLEYRDVVVGGGKEAKVGMSISVDYVGSLDDGTIFDSNRGGAAFEFTLGTGQVIRGWDEGLVGARVGGRRKLVIPPGLAYGAAGAPPKIPPGATLTFVCDLVGATDHGAMIQWLFSPAHLLFAALALAALVAAYAYLKDHPLSCRLTRRPRGTSAAEPSHHEPAANYELVASRTSDAV